jgi:hypothetical protein
VKLPARQAGPVAEPIDGILISCSYKQANDFNFTRWINSSFSNMDNHPPYFPCQILWQKYPFPLSLGFIRPIQLFMRNDANPQVYTRSNFFIL